MSARVVGGAGYCPGDVSKTRTVAPAGIDAHDVEWTWEPAATCVAAVPTGRFPNGTSPPDRGATPSADPRAVTGRAPTAAAFRVGLLVTCVFQSTVPENVVPPPVVPPPASRVATRESRALTFVSAVPASVAAWVASTPARMAPRRASSPYSTRYVTQASAETRTAGAVLVKARYPYIPVVVAGRSARVSAFRTSTAVPDGGRMVCPAAAGFGTST
jgi:hypothetical protein